MDRLLQSRARQAEADFRASAERLLGPLRVQFNDATRLRLLILTAWAIRYRVDLGFILTTLFDRYSKIMSKRKRYALGIGVPTLTGERSRQMLEEAIVEEFPGGENVRVWRQREQQRILGLHVLTKRNDLPAMLFPEQYAKRVSAQRRAAEEALVDVPKRPYRLNPFGE